MCIHSLLLRMMLRGVWLYLCRVVLGCLRVRQPWVGAGCGGRLRACNAALCRGTCRVLVVRLVLTNAAPWAARNEHQKKPLEANLRQQLA